MGLLRPVDGDADGEPPGVLLHELLHPGVIAKGAVCGDVYHVLGLPAVVQLKGPAQEICHGLVDEVNFQEWLPADKLNDQAVSVPVIDQLGISGVLGKQQVHTALGCLQIHLPVRLVGLIAVGAAQIALVGDDEGDGFYLPAWEHLWVGVLKLPGVSAAIPQSTSPLPGS